MLIIDVFCFISCEKANMICVVLLQDSMSFVEGETGSCTETGVECDDDRNEEVSIKVEEAVDIEDEIPEPISFSPIKAEQQVSCGLDVRWLAVHGFRPFIAPKRKL
jgi:hypothetical protein